LFGFDHSRYFNTQRDKKRTRSFFDIISREVFTGIIEELGTVSSVTNNNGGVRLIIAAPLVASDAQLGDSIAVNGVCLTVIEIGETLSFDVSPETLERTSLRSIRAKSAVNLERALLPTTRLGGHIVQGHVDCSGNFVSAANEGDFWTVRIEFPTAFGKYLIYKGSVAVDGISLTVAALGDNYFDIAVIPKTWQMTNLSSLKSGDAVNLEADVIAKYVERLTMLS